jgi:hypothetical protein
MSRKFQPDPHIAVTIGGTLVGASVLMLLWVFLSSEGSFASSGHRFTIRGAAPESKLVFDLGKEQQLSLRVLDFEEQKRAFGSAAISGVLHYLKPEAYQTFETRYRSVERCPASFLNWNAGHLYLLAEDESLVQRINQAAMKRGDEVTLEGAYLEFTEGLLGGQSLQMPSGNARYFLIRSLTLNGREYRGRSALPIGDIELLMPS